MILLDTNIVIYLAQGKIDAQKFFKDDEVYAVSVITYVEIMSFVKEDEKEFMQEFFDNVEILEIDVTIANECVQLRKEYVIKLADALIAATALVYEARLVSADKVFTKIKQLDFEGVTL